MNVLFMGLYHLNEGEIHTGFLALVPIKGIGMVHQHFTPVPALQAKMPC
jgi:ABC-type uncharacterized transport system ATPase subunit